MALAQMDPSQLQAEIGALRSILVRLPGQTTPPAEQPFDAAREAEAMRQGVAGVLDGADGPSLTKLFDHAKAHHPPGRDALEIARVETALYREALLRKGEAREPPNPVRRTKPDPVHVLGAVKLIVMNVLAASPDEQLIQANRAAFAKRQHLQPLAGDPNIDAALLALRIEMDLLEMVMDFNGATARYRAANPSLHPLN